MLLSSSYLFSHTISYFTENLTCLFYGFELLATRFAFFASYYDLLADLAEAFGVWVALTVLVLSALTSMVVVHQIAAYTWDAAKTSFTKDAQEASSKTVAYRSFFTFIKLRKLL